MPAMTGGLSGSRCNYEGLTCPPGESHAYRPRPPKYKLCHSRVPRARCCPSEGSCPAAQSELSERTRAVGSAAVAHSSGPDVATTREQP
jgi:hypothetical protein